MVRLPLQYTQYWNRSNFNQESEPRPAGYLLLGRVVHTVCRWWSQLVGITYLKRNSLPGGWRKQFKIRKSGILAKTSLGTGFLNPTTASKLSAKRKKKHSRRYFISGVSLSTRYSAETCRNWQVEVGGRKIPMGVRTPEFRKFPRLGFLSEQATKQSKTIAIRTPNNGEKMIRSLASLASEWSSLNKYPHRNDC